MKSRILVLATGLLFIIQAHAATVSTVELAGSACQNPVGSHDATEVSEGRYEIPLGLYVKKDEDLRVARGTCVFALPVKAAPGKKLIASNLRQLVHLRAYPSQTRVQMDLEVFSAGQRGEPLRLKIEAVDKIAKLQTTLENSEVVFETQCGGSAILRGNLAATIMGAGKARAFARNLFIDLKEVSCQ